MRNWQTPLALMASAVLAFIVGVYTAGLFARPADPVLGPSGPVVVGQGPSNPARERLYTVNVFADGELVGQVGCDYFYELDELLRGQALRWACPPREWGRTEDGMIDLTDRLRPRPIRVQIWDNQQQKWHHPGGVKMPEDWDGTLPLAVTVNVGSYRIE